MSIKLTFGEYVQSKEQLRSAITNTPERIAEYEVHKYCKLPINDKKQKVSLRPKHRIIIKWLYENEEPIPVNIRFEGPQEIDPDEEASAAWNGERLLKWLLRNTNESN